MVGYDPSPVPLQTPASQSNACASAIELTLPTRVEWCQTPFDAIPGSGGLPGGVAAGEGDHVVEGRGVRRHLDGRAEGQGAVVDHGVVGVVGGRAVDDESADELEAGLVDLVGLAGCAGQVPAVDPQLLEGDQRSEEHTSELQSLLRI